MIEYVLLGKIPLIQLQLGVWTWESQGLPRTLFLSLTSSVNSGKLLSVSLSFLYSIC